VRCHGNGLDITKLTPDSMCNDSEITPEGKKEIKREQVLLNGNNVCLVRVGVWLFGR
jgi:hypothetical protein